MHKIRFSWTVAALTVLGLAAVISGCLVSGTKVFTFGLSDVAVTGGAFTRTPVDFTQNSTYQDHKDDIRLIDRFGFTCNIINPNANPVDVSVYFSTNPNLGDSEVPTSATPLFRNFRVGANTTEPITYDESLDLLENFDALQQVVDAGAFTFYSQSANGSFNFAIDDPVLIVTFTVGL